MPVIKVWGVPIVGCTDRREQLKRALKSVVASIHEIDLGAGDVTILFPCDSLSQRGQISDDIIIEVTGLFVTEKRTFEVRSRLAMMLGQAVSAQYVKAKVECFIYPFDPRQGFWVSEETVRHWQPS